MIQIYNLQLIRSSIFIFQLWAYYNAILGWRTVFIANIAYDFENFLNSSPTFLLFVIKVCFAASDSSIVLARFGISLWSTWLKDKGCTEYKIYVNIFYTCVHLHDYIISSIIWIDSKWEGFWPPKPLQCARVCSIRRRK